MTDAQIQETFEAYFEKYKKTEGDRTSWSAHWTDHGPDGTFEINLTKCPRGTIFKPFAAGKKLPEIVGWDEFFKAMPKLESEYEGLFDRERFFSGMKEMI